MCTNGQSLPASSNAISPTQFGAAWAIHPILPKSPIRVTKRPVTAGERAAASTLVSSSWELSRYRSLDILGPYATLENVKENDFCEKPAGFEDKVRDVVAPVHGDQ